MTICRQIITDYLSRYDHPKSIQIKRSIIEQFVLTIGITRFQDVLGSHLTDYRQYLEKSHSKASVRVCLESLKHFFKWLTQNGQIFVNPAQDLILPKPMPCPRPIPSSTDIHKLFLTLNLSSPVGIRDQAIFTTIVTCAPRRQEIMDLTVLDVDLTHLTLRISGEKARVIPLWQPTAQNLTTYIQDVRPKLLKDPARTDLWISNRTGRGLSQVQMDRLIREHGKKAGIRASHAFLRRAGIVYMLENGVALEQLPGMLGYAEVKSMSRIGIKIKKMRQIAAKKETSNASSC